MAELAYLSLRLGEALRERGVLLATAESCTGGWVAKVVTDTPGSSAWFDRGFVTYSNEAKHELLGVPTEILTEHGAVSAETVRAMAFGALANSRAGVALAISGVAGPGGGSADKPVGTVWIAWAGASIEGRVEGFRFPGDRAAVRRQAVTIALEGLLEGLGGA
jgi:nicotinamide-nucleotide amidase